ncbi:MAG TPA: peptidoglycan DD-metalloendopeptidase family protein [Lacibacter sp.]|nr:peptidoglycan DD-metalloendopeptidase family protein [Lacibacter sp.]HMO87967.1 peptidoglycan DD-metalloendopeptidase family protein [Lacibacter sp.]HMP86072.1 peptidoglycan DD-metalloendopeptidase family protein [Lacibacter sp.]
MASPLITILQGLGHNVHPVVPFNPDHDRLLALDFTAANNALMADIIEDTTLFSAYVEQRLQRTGARYGIGGYDEHRTVYSRSRVFDAPDGGEPRRLHLGTDIWGAAGTPVFAPLSGTIEATAFHNRLGDYGAMLIVRHEVDGLSFYTLYGHLSAADLHWQPGQEAEAGTLLAHFGPPAENGQWPPHLHFQLLLDLQDHVNDYPGVCRYSEREQYLANCPDPDYLLQLNRYL